MSGWLAGTVANTDARETTNGRLHVAADGGGVLLRLFAAGPDAAHDIDGRKVAVPASVLGLSVDQARALADALTDAADHAQT